MQCTNLRALFLRSDTERVRVDLQNQTPARCSSSSYACKHNLDVQSYLFDDDEFMLSSRLLHNLGYHKRIRHLRRSPGPRSDQSCRSRAVFSSWSSWEPCRAFFCGGDFKGGLAWSEEADGDVRKSKMGNYLSCRGGDSLGYGLKVSPPTPPHPPEAYTLSLSLYDIYIYICIYDMIFMNTNRGTTYKQGPYL